MRPIKEYKYATSRNAGCTPYQEMLCMSEEQYMATSKDAMHCTSHQEIREVCHSKKHNVSVCHIRKLDTLLMWRRKFKYAISENLVRHISEYAASGFVSVCAFVCVWEGGGVTRHCISVSRFQLQYPGRGGAGRVCINGSVQRGSNNVCNIFKYRFNDKTQFHANDLMTSTFDRKCLDCIYVNGEYHSNM